MQNEYRKEEMVSQLISLVDPTEKEAALETILESMTMSGGHCSLSSMLPLLLFEYILVTGCSGNGGSLSANIGFLPLI